MGCCFSSNGPTTPPPDIDWSKNPFIAASAHHRPIGSDAIFASGSHPSVANWATVTSMSLNIGSPYGCMYYPVDDDSPRVTIAQNPVHENKYRDVPASNIAYTPSPTDIKFSSGTDKNDSMVTFVHRVTGECCEFRECGPPSALRTASNPMLAGSLRRFWVTVNGNPNVGVTSGLGHGLAAGDRVGHTAAGISFPFGLIRSWELTSPEPIGHVLQLIVPGTPNGAIRAGCAQLASRLKVLPATDVDGHITDAGNGLGTIAYGSVMSLPHGFDLGIFSGLNALQMKIVRAVHDYGMVMLDTGGLVGPRAAQDVTSAQGTQIRGALNAMRPHLRLITNCAWDPSNRLKPTGGGTPRADNTAYF